VQTLPNSGKRPQTHIPETKRTEKTSAMILVAIYPTVKTGREKEEVFLGSGVEAGKKMGSSL